MSRRNRKLKSLKSENLDNGLINGFQSEIIVGINGVMEQENIVNNVEASEEYEDVDNVQDPLGETYSREIRPFIDAIDNLRRFGLQKDIDLPRVVVLGDQSSGKSSIIEAISGIELPRGKGIVTRCPLELQLSRVMNQKWSATLSYKNVSGELVKLRTEDPSEVEEKIRTAQENMCNTRKGVSSELITLRIESPAKSAPDLTLIDLPGIARTAVEDQPADICTQIRNILQTYIKEENTVILCVISANLDLAVNESLSMAKEFDPDNTRTFGVITKPDMAIEDSSKEEVMAILNNEKIHLKKGYVMVKCRSQKQLEEKMTLSDSLQFENEYFQNDEHYKTADRYKLGTRNLAMKLTEELVDNIKQTLPHLMKTIESKITETEKILATLPRGVPQTQQDKTVFLVETMSDINQTIKEAFARGKNQISKESHFSKWRGLFEEFKKEIEKKYKESLNTKFSKEIMENEIKSRRGCEIMGFLNFDLFQDLITDHISFYESDAFTLLDEMVKDAKSVILNLLDRNFPNLKQVLTKLKKIVEDEMVLYTIDARNRLVLVFAEEKLIFTMDSTFNKELDYFNKSQLKIKKKEMKKTTSMNNNSNYNSTNTEPNIDIDVEEETLSKRNMKDMDNADKLKLIIQCYLQITNSRLSDCIPMAIRHVLHVQLIESLRTKFFEYSTKIESTQDLAEDRSVANKRQENESKLERLRKARKELSCFM